MRGDEERVVAVFATWLKGQGWTVEREVDYCDIVAHRGEETLYAEAKGRTAAISLDVDTLYGQLLRRVPLDATGARFGVVVPSEARAAALRVPDSVRRTLGITVFVVDAAGEVEEITPADSDRTKRRDTALERISAQDAAILAKLAAGPPASP